MAGFKHGFGQEKHDYKKYCERPSGSVPSLMLFGSSELAFPIRNVEVNAKKRTHNGQNQPTHEEIIERIELSLKRESTKTRENDYELYASTVEYMGQAFSLALVMT